MRGTKSEDLTAIIDFLYCGKANVYQEHLDSFLAIAGELELKGFLKQNNDQNTNPTFKTIETIAKPCISKTKLLDTVNEKPDKSIIKEHLGSGNILQELDEKVKSMMGETPNLISNGKQRARTCKVCGKEGHGMNIRDHIEVYHIAGISLPCNICERTFRSKSSLTFYMYKCDS